MRGFLSLLSTRIFSRVRLLISVHLESAVSLAREESILASFFFF